MIAPELGCPVPHPLPPRVTLAHGSGGSATHRLVRDLFAARLANPILAQAHDAALLPEPGARLAFTTDTYVVRPIEFPGGDIGSLAVHGTVNDLAMSGAAPRYLSAAFVLEEGLPLEVLARIVDRMRAAADACGVVIAAGDTKVVERRTGDGLHICTSGIGTIAHALDIAPASVRPGDAVVVSGDIGRHGIAVMAAREGLEFDPPLESDSAPLHAAVGALLEAGIEVHCLRDCTRGGLASALNEIAETAALAIAIDEPAIPIHPNVRGACELLGLDPCHVACEGRFIAFLPASQAPAALEVLGAHACGLPPAQIGQVRPGPAGRVTLRNTLGVDRLLDMLPGEQLPRIC